MELIGRIITAYLKRPYGRIRRYMDSPESVQREVLDELLRSACETAFGIEHGYTDISGLRDYQERVPVRSYEEFQPWIERVQEGEAQVLWPSPIRWLAKSSGTSTGRSKYLPVSREALDKNHFQGPRDMMCMYARNHPDTQIFTGKSLIMGGSESVYAPNPRMHCGDVSAIMMRNQPPLASFLRTPGLEVALMEDWEQKIERMADITVDQRITSLAGVPTWTLVFIRNLLERTGKSCLKDIWPHLELYMHGGVNFAPYAESFRELVGGAGIRYYQTYNASEGFFAFQDRAGADDMLLALDNGIFYEFIPKDRVGDAHPAAVSVGDAEPGIEYALVISTNSGLWRYRVGDTVELTSRKPFRIRVTGRVGRFINAFGEEVVEDNAERALAAACDVSAARVRNYTVAPVYFSDSRPGSHEWLIEFEVPPTDPNLFARSLDGYLQRLNSDYAAKRAGDLALGPPVITTAPDGLFYRWLEMNGRLGGQYKVPRLSNDRELIGELLAVRTC